MDCTYRKARGNITVTCRVCKNTTNQNGLLSCCTNKDCGAVHWDKMTIKKLVRQHPDLRNAKNNQIIKGLLVEANVPNWVAGESYVYVIRLRGTRPEETIGRVYVGMTSLHPYQRYFNHLRGYQASRVVKRYGTAMLFYEGPMSKIEAETREVVLAEALRQKGYDVHGGH